MVVPIEHSHLLVFESEARVMASRSCRPDGCEDGLDFWGYYTRGGRQLIHLVTTSGPGAIRAPTRYVQDPDFFKGIHRQLSESYGCTCLGGAHDHHRLGLDGPSSVDVQQVMNISRRNGFRRWCEIITTGEESAGRPSRYSGYGRTMSVPRIRLNAYSYLDPQQGTYVKTRLLVLPGISPLRLALAHRREIPPEALGEDGLFFPLSHVVYDACTETDGGDAESEECIEELSRQCRQLPEDLQQSLRVEAENGTISVLVHLTAEDLLTVRYGGTPDLMVESVILQRGNTGPAHDLTRQCAGAVARRPLKRICAYAMALINRNKYLHVLNLQRSPNKAHGNTEATHAACNCIKETTNAPRVDNTRRRTRLDGGSLDA